MSVNSTIEELFESTFHYFPRNGSYVIPGLYDLPLTDATFPLLCCFIIFQMQTGIALLEAGIVKRKNAINVMMKHVADVCIGGIAFFIFGFALMFGRGEFSTPFFGLGDFFVNAKYGDPLSCQVLMLFLYQMSYATVSNSIVSGAIAERVKFGSYCLLTFPMTVLYCVGAGWVWGEHGFLKNLGCVDLSGGVIHIIGGSAGIACAWYLGPRTGRYKNGIKPLPMGNTMNSLIGLFLVWWGWMTFNGGCAYGVSGGKWEYALRAAIGTALASWGAGFVSIIYSMKRNNGKVDIFEVISGVLSGLIMINASCYLMPFWLCIVTGGLSAFFSLAASPLPDMLKIDDAIGVFSVHWIGGIFGYITVGLFSENPVPLTTTMGKIGLFMGGGPNFIIIQIIGIICLTLLGFFGALPIVYLSDKISPLRLDLEEEEKGSDLVEHEIDENPYIDEIESMKTEQNHLNVIMSMNQDRRNFQEFLRQRNQVANEKNEFCCDWAPQYEYPLNSISSRL